MLRGRGQTGVWGLMVVSEESIMTSHKYLNAPTLHLFQLDSQLLMRVCLRCCRDFGPVGWCEITAVNEKNKTGPASSQYLSSTQINKGATTQVTAITFECQKIILAVIFFNITATAKAINGHGENGNDFAR